MGTFERIRQISPYFFGIFAVLLIAYFVFTSGGEDIARQAQNDPRTSAIAIVNGESLLNITFREEVDRRVEQQRMSMQPGQEQTIDEASIRNQVFNEMVEEMIIRQEAAKLGIMVTKAEIVDLLVENPPDFLKRGFIDTAGNFRKNVYLELITNPEAIVNYMAADPTQVPEDEKRKAIHDFRNELIMIEEALRKQKIQEYLTDAVNTAESFISPAYAKENYLNENSSADFEYIQISINEIDAKSVEISDKAIEDYYNENKKYYKQEPQRKIKYVSFKVIPSETDSMNAKKRVQTISEDLQKGSTFEERDSIFDIVLDKYIGETKDFTLVKDLPANKADYLMQLTEREVLGPVLLNDGTYFFRLDGKRTGEQEVVKASHILINTNGNNDSALTVANDLYKRAKAGEDFAMLARQYSQDKGSGTKGGDVGYFGKDQMVKPFEEAAFAAQVGEITSPVESRFGYHIIKVVDKKSEEISWSEIQILPKVSVPTENKLKMDANNFKNQVVEGENFDTLAKRLNIEAAETAFFIKARPILGSQYLTDLAFNTEKGEVIKIIELDFYGYIVAQVSEVREAGVKPLEDVKEEITNKLIKSKRLDGIKVKAEKLAKSAQQSGSLSVDPAYEVKNISGVNNTGVLPGLGRQFAVSNAAYSLQIGKISDAVRGDNGYYVLKVTNRQVPDDAKVKQELPDIMKKLRNQKKAMNYYQWLAKIRNDADVEDNRYMQYSDY